MVFVSALPKDFADREVKLYYPEQRRVFTVELSGKGEEKIELGKRDVTARRYTVRSPMGEIDGNIWIGADGRLPPRGQVPHVHPHRALESRRRLFQPGLQHGVGACGGLGEGRGGGEEGEEDGKTAGRQDGRGGGWHGRWQVAGDKWQVAGGTMGEGAAPG